MLYLAGGGDEKDSELLDKKFAQAVNAKRLIYIPIAMDGVSPTYDECSAWISSIFTPLGIKHIEMRDSLSHDFTSKLNANDMAIYIGGGNTYKLLDTCRKTGFDVALKQFVKCGGLVYGGSAGAILLGKDINTCSAFDTNDVGIVDTAGLGIIGKYSIWCHYEKEHDSIIQKLGYPIIAIPEQSGIIFDGFHISIIGHDEITVFEKGWINRLKPNETISV